MKSKPAAKVRGANPPFFPTHVYETTGARLLDFYAGLAPGMPEWFEPGMRDPLARLARWRFTYAEAMLRERGRPH
jgi:hypothetical protein